MTHYSAILWWATQTSNPLWRGDFKSCTFSRLAIFYYRDIGYRQDLTGKMKTKSGIFPKPEFEKVFFIVRCEPPAIRTWHSLPFSAVLDLGSLRTPTPELYDNS